MPRHLVPLLLLALLCGCATNHHSATSDSEPNLSFDHAGWGNLPALIDQPIVHAVPPHYPLEAKTAGELGDVIVAALVDEDGEVLDVRLAQSSGVIAVDRAALEAVRHWQYAPVPGLGRHITLQPVSLKLG